MITVLTFLVFLGFVALVTFVTRMDLFSFSTNETLDYFLSSPLSFFLPIEPTPFVELEWRLICGIMLLERAFFILSTFWAIFKSSGGTILGFVLIERFFSLGIEFCGF